MQWAKAGSAISTRDNGLQSCWAPHGWLVCYVSLPYDLRSPKMGKCQNIYCQEAWERDVKYA